MASLILENENRQLKEIIQQLRVKLEKNYLEMQKKIAKERADYNQIIIQLQGVIVGLRNELESIQAHHINILETLKKNKNNEIHQLQDTIKEVRRKLEEAIAAKNL